MIMNTENSVLTSKMSSTFVGMWSVNLIIIMSILVILTTIVDYISNLLSKLLYIFECMTSELRI